MYSGNLASTKVLFDSEAVAKTPAKLRPYLASGPKADAHGVTEFSLIRWQLNSTSSVPYPEVRTYREVIRALCNKMPAEAAAHIQYSIEEKSGFLRQPWKTEGRCSDQVHIR
jgi:hypothetical protein